MNSINTMYLVVEALRKSIEDYDQYADSAHAYAAINEKLEEIKAIIQTYIE